MLRLGLGREKYSSSSGPRQGCSMLEPSITGPWYRARIEALILKRNGTISLMSRPGLKSLGSIACFQLNMTLYCEMSLHSPSRGTSLLSSSAPQAPPQAAGKNRFAGSNATRSTEGHGSHAELPPGARCRLQ